MDSKQKKELTKRIKYVVGHLSAIEKMIEEGRDSSEIYAQLRAVESAFSKSVLDTFEKEHRLELAERVVEALENCLGTCEYCDLVDTLKRDFPKLTLTQVLDGLHQISTKRIKEEGTFSTANAAKSAKKNQQTRVNDQK